MKQSYCKNNTYKKLNDFDIVVLLDGDDWLAKNNVLDLLCNEYNKNECLLLYSNYLVYYDNEISKNVVGNEYPIEVKKNKSYRTFPSWLFTHLKSGYAWLFKKIPDSYFKKDGKWLDRCTDLAEMYGASEIACMKVKHVNETLYVYNKQNSLKYVNSYYNDYQSENRKNIENHVKSLKPLNFVLPKMYIINLKNKNELKENIIFQMNNLFIDKNQYEFFEALNGYTDQKIIDKYEEYNLKYNNNKINKTTLTVTKKHINSLGALGIIYSTIELYKKINGNGNINHVLILEDDVYFHKNFHLYYQLLDKDLKNKDFIFLGFNSIGKKFMNVIDEKNVKLINIKDIDYGDDTIYGAYSYICSRKYRNFIIKLGIEFFIENNVNLDAALNIYFNNNDEKYVENDLNFYLLNNHLFIPEVRKNGINKSRNNNYYIERNIDLNNYLI